MVSEDNKRIAKNTILLYVRTLFSQLLGLYTSRKVLEILGVEDYGVYNVVGGITALLLFLNGSMAVATQRYLTIELGKKNLSSYNTIFSMACIIHAVLALIVFILAETIGLWFLNNYLNLPLNRFYAANWVYQFSVLSMIVGILQVPYSASLTSHERLDVYAYVGMGEAVLRLCFVLLLSVLTYDRLITYSFFSFIVQLISAIIYFIYCVRTFLECKFRLVWKPFLFNSMLTFTGWNLFGTLAWILKDQGSNILMNIFGGPLINAARGISLQVSSAVQNLVSGFSSAVAPQLTKNYAVKDENGLYRLFVVSSKISFFLFLLVALPIIFETPYLLQLWLIEVPEYSVLFIRIILLEAIFNTLSGPMITSLLATGNIKLYQIVVGGVMLLNIPISFVLLYLGAPIETPLIVSFIIIIISIVVRIYFCKLQLSFNILSYMNLVLRPVISVFVLSLVLPYLVNRNMEYGFWNFIMTSLVSIFSVFISTFFVGFSNSERTFVYSIINGKLKKWGK